MVVVVSSVRELAVAGCVVVVAVGAAVDGSPPSLSSVATATTPLRATSRAHARRSRHDRTKERSPDRARFLVLCHAAAMPKWTVTTSPIRPGRTVLVTGANSGLGLRSAEALAAAGARVLLACRNAEKAAAALESVKAKATGAAPEVVQLDLADLDSVEAARRALDGRVDHIDVLMNNAGVMALPLRRTPQGFEMQFGTNHLGHFALTGRLLPALLRAPDAPRGRRVLDGPPTRAASAGTTSTGTRAATRTGRPTARPSSPTSCSPASCRAGPPWPGTARRRRRPSGLRGDPPVARRPGDGGQPVMRDGDEAVRPALRPVRRDGRAAPALRGDDARRRADDYWGPDGFLEQRGYPKRVAPHQKAAQDGRPPPLEDAAEALTGVTYDWG